MPYQKITVRPGFNSQATQLLNEGGWSFGNLVRFRFGLLEKIGGWAQLFSAQLAGVARAIHAYEDLALSDTLLIAGDGGPQIYADGVLYDFAVASVGTSNTVSIAATNGSNVATVTDPTSKVALGQPITFLVVTSIGGLIIPAGTTFSVNSIVGSGQYTFLLPSLATTNAAGAVPIFSIPIGVSPPASVTVELTNHGRSAGQTFTVDQTTSFIQSGIGGPGTLSVQAQAGSTYPIVSISDANNFIISGFGASNAEFDGATVTEGVTFNGTAFTSFCPWIAYDTAPPPAGTVWFVDNLGNNGLFQPAGSPLYVYSPPASNPAAVLPSVGNGATGFTASQVNNGMFVAMPQAQVVLFGTEGVFGSGQIDPLLVRWSDAGSYSTWIATTTNEAGSFRLSRGSKIVGGLQAPQSSLLWTDVDLWSMAYIGPPLIYSFTTVGTGCGLIAPHAAAVQGRNTFWMSQNAIWAFGDSGAQAIECPLWDLIFPVLDRANAQKIVAGSNSATQEIIFFYPVVGGNGECTNYVIYQTLEGLWSYGQGVPPPTQDATSMGRSAWIDESVFGAPLGADYSLLVQQHEVGYDANGAPMNGAYAETGFFDVGDGTTIPFLDLLIPDLKWLGQNGFVELTIWTQGTSGQSPTMYGPFPATALSGIISTGGIRSRQMAIRIDWGVALGFNARLGATRARISPSGRVQ